VVVVLNLKQMLSRALIISLCAVFSCKDEPRSIGTPPPPPPSAGAVAACGSGGGQIADAISAPLFPRVVGAGSNASYCLDPHGDEKTYGEKGKLGINELCSTALDGGCEEYKKFGVTRSVIVHYVANAGLASVEVFLSRFANDGAYTIYTTRLTGEADPLDEHSSRPLALEAAGASGAMGFGKAYAQRGPYFLELTYNNDQETPEQLKKSSEKILVQIARDVVSKLPTDPDVPASAKALPTTDRIANGVMYFDRDLLGIASAGAGAIGYFKGAKRYRVVSAVRDTPDQAKDLIHLLRTKPGALPVANIGDEAVEVVLQPTPERAKIDWLVVRKNGNVLGVGDEEFVAQDAKMRLTKDEKLEKVRALIK
jgi:hypothetical protein